MAGITLEHVTKSFGSVTAVDDVSLEIGDGEFLVLVGPSGCGKSTLLRMIAGLEEATGGAILIGERDVTDLAPRSRDIAMVFQTYALYPHMSVRQNLGYGLKARRTPKAEIARRVEEVAELLGLQEMLDRRPAQLSGGQRQRVAMGRAIVREPDAFLMDEPLSNLDAKLRVEMRAYVGLLHQRLHTTTVYVTHDQTEAMTMGDRVAVMRNGLLVQCDVPRELYQRPADLFVATFIGSPAMNLVRSPLVAENGDVRVRIGDAALRLPRDVLDRHPSLQQHVGRDVVVGIRPEDVEDAALLPSPNGAAILDVRVALAESTGAEVIAYFPVHTANGEATLTARLSPRTRAETGGPLRVAIDADRLHFFDPETELAIA
jgi:multiple sugar transport system ATP-binding protein